MCQPAIAGTFTAPPVVWLLDDVGDGTTEETGPRIPAWSNEHGR